MWPSPAFQLTDLPDRCSCSECDVFEHRYKLIRLDLELLDQTVEVYHLAALVFLVCQVTLSCLDSKYGFLFFMCLDYQSTKLLKMEIRSIQNFLHKHFQIFVGCLVDSDCKLVFVFFFSSQLHKPTRRPV